MKGLVGQQIKQFHIKSMLGQGSSGTVYQATDLKRGQVVAVKFANSKLATNADARRQFLQEADVAERLNHPHIVQTYEAGRERDLLYLVMSYYAQGNLTQALAWHGFQNATLTLREVLVIVSQLAEALAYAHDGGVIHGDVKPDNVLVGQLFSAETDTDWQVALADFGLAQLIDAHYSEATTKRTGSWPYMSPERFKTEKLHPSADVYSLGILFYQLATGQLPFEPTSWVEAEEMHVQELPASPSSLNIDLPSSVERVIQRAIAKDSAERYQSGGEMAAAMRDLATQLLGGSVVAVPNAQKLTAWPTQSLGVVSGIDSSLIQVNQLVSDTEDRITVSRASPTVHGLKDKQVVTVGRSPDSDIQLDAPSISARHANLRRTEEGWEIVDLGSTNGVYLDRDHLLPDVAQVWKAHQTMRVGPFYLRLQTVDDDGDGLADRLLLGLNPTRSEVLLGEEQSVEVIVVNQSQQRDLLKFEVESSQSGWIFLVQDTVELAPSQRAVLPLKMRPPRMQTELVMNEHRFKIVATSLLRSETPFSVEGSVFVDAAHDFQLSAGPLQFNGNGVVELNLNNDSPVEKLFTMRLRQRREGLQFGPWRGLGLSEGVGDLAVPEDEEAAAETLKKALPTTKRIKNFEKNPIVQILNRIPIFKRYVTQPIKQSMVVLQFRELKRMGNYVKRYQKMGNKLMDETGFTFDLSRLRGKSSAAGSYHVARFDGEWDEIEAVYGVPQRDAALLAINVSQARRPWFGRKQTHPYEVELSTSGQSPQRLNGAVHIKPRIPMWATVLGTLLCISALILGSWYVRTNHGWLAFFDTDGDSLSDSSELYQHKTDPLRADTDKDNLSDRLELLLGTDPLLSDTDGDGLIDSREQLPLDRINLSEWDQNKNGRLDGQERVDVHDSDVFKADSDEDGFLDGLEADTCNDPLQFDIEPVMRENCIDIVVSPTPTPQVAYQPPTLITGTLALTPTQVITQHGTISIASDGSLFPTDNEVLSVGDYYTSDDPLESGHERFILTFNAANLPEGAQIHAVELVLYQLEVEGDPESLGSVWIDVASEDGFGFDLRVDSADFETDAHLPSLAQLFPRVIDVENEITLWTANLNWAASQLDTTTQLRFFTSIANNYDGQSDLVAFYPLDPKSEAEQQPQLIVSYSYQK